MQQPNTDLDITLNINLNTIGANINDYIPNIDWNNPEKYINMTIKSLLVSFIIDKPSISYYCSYIDFTSPIISNATMTNCDISHSIFDNNLCYTFENNITDGRNIPIDHIMVRHVLWHLRGRYATFNDLRDLIKELYDINIINSI